MGYRFSISILSVIILCISMAGCGLFTPVRESVEDKAETMRKGPESAAQKNMTNMADSLRCMDRLFIENGIRDLVVLTEDIHDNTKKMSVGARDMLTSAVSDMTRRSRAIRLITFGGDVSNLVNWLNASGGNTQVYTFKPDFDIRGSISQMDDNLTQSRKGGGVTVGPVDVDASKDAGASVIGLDMSIISSQTMELLPGVTSRNSILIVKEGKGFGVGVTGSIYKQNFGVNYDFSFNKNESSAQAVRTLIELAVIELFGKLTRVPYWNCLGIDPNHPLIKEEISDWFYTLNQEGKLVPYIQNQFRIRGVYSGPVDGSLNPEFRAVVPKARKALGLNESDVIDEAMFAGLVNLKTKNLGFPSEPVAHLTVAQFDEKKGSKKIFRKKKKKTKRSISEQADNDEFETTAQKLNPSPLDLTSKPVAPGAELSVTVKSSENTFLYCYMNTADNSLMRIYPNRYSPDPWLAKNMSMTLPGNMKLRLKAGPAGKNERIYCYNTPKDVSYELPASAMGGDFEPLTGYTPEKLHADFVVASSGSVTEKSIQIIKK